MVKGRFVDLILSGKKTTTIRLGRVVPKHDEIIIHGGGRPIAKAKIKRVVYKRVRELTEEDARKDGYNSLEELLQDLENVYGRRVYPDDIVTIIEFEVIQTFTDLNPEDVYLGLNPIDIARIAYRYLRKELTEDEKKILEALLRYRSIREAALKLFGSLGKRWIIRKVLRKCLRRLLEKGILKVDEEKLRKASQIMPSIARVVEDKESKS
ncbi:MAG TPA: ASCH domain-containing protein [Ignisphaera aggregans]|uniref:ASCH domain-containing protein n=1 Tax=Ignisphaera aggregans TaxID=334771 RepID=A0A832YYU7_9CREN|nr:ASCH domain-containing protein [Ignisphaera aggregans]